MAGNRSDGVERGRSGSVIIREWHKASGYAITPFINGLFIDSGRAGVVKAVWMIYSFDAASKLSLAILRAAETMMGQASMQSRGKGRGGASAESGAGESVP